MSDGCWRTIQYTQYDERSFCVKREGAMPDGQEEEAEHSNAASLFEASHHHRGVRDFYSGDYSSDLVTEIPSVLPLVNPCCCHGLLNVFD